MRLCARAQLAGPRLERTSVATVSRLAGALKAGQARPAASTPALLGRCGSATIIGSVMLLRAPAHDIVQRPGRRPTYTYPICQDRACTMCHRPAHTTFELRRRFGKRLYASTAAEDGWLSGQERASRILPLSAPGGCRRESVRVNL